MLFVTFGLLLLIFSFSLYCALELRVFVSCTISATTPATTTTSSTIL